MLGHSGCIRQILNRAHCPNGIDRKSIGHSSTFVKAMRSQSAVRIICIKCSINFAQIVQCSAHNKLSHNPVLPSLCLFQLILVFKELCHQFLNFASHSK